MQIVDTAREGMALLTDWNAMTRMSQFQIRPGKIYFWGRAAGQGAHYTGGSLQMFIINPGYLIKL